MTDLNPVESSGHVLFDGALTSNPKLDAALADTLPATDPTAITVPQAWPERGEGVLSDHRGSST